MADGDVFRHGAVQFPLTSSTAHSLLRDADPALFYAIEFFAAALRVYIGPRLKSQALLLLEKLKVDDAVARTLHVEPSPFLLAEKYAFPLFALYRRGETDTQDTASYRRSVSEWEFSYVLPSLTSTRSIEQLQPILHAVSRVISQVAVRGRDPNINGGASAWSLAGIESCRVKDIDYGVYEPIDDSLMNFRCVVGKLQVVERDRPIDDLLQPLDGATLTVDHQAPDATLVTELVVAATYPGPTLTSIVPNLGSKSGGTIAVINGTGFRVGTTPRIFIGGAACSTVEVLSATQLRVVVPKHDGYPGFVGDVVVIADDNQRAALPSAFEFTSP